MNLLECILTKNDCYKAGKTITPKGVMVHSTGANNTSLKRYVQPTNDAAMLALLGKNNNGNDWNRSGLDVCVHAFIGKLADGSIASVQTLPWNYRGWHCGSTGNNTHISFEICEDALTDSDYFDKIYTEAVELTAYLCNEYGLDPTADGVVICHSEGYKRGIASNHTDVEHWFPTFGKSMDDYRTDVRNAMEGDVVTYEQWKEFMLQYREELQEKDGSDYSAEAREFAINKGLIQGDQFGRYMWQDFITREQFATVMKRYDEAK